MATNDASLISEIRDFDSGELQNEPNSELETVISRAKKHIKLQARLPPEDVDWYGDEDQEEALFWASMLFSKLSTGELDSKTIELGAVTEQSLLAAGDETTAWYRKYDAALNRVIDKFNSGNNIVRSTRTSTAEGGRQYDTNR